MRVYYDYYEDISKDCRDIVWRELPRMIRDAHTYGTDCDPYKLLDELKDTVYQPLNAAEAEKCLAGNFALFRDAVLSLGDEDRIKAASVAYGGGVSTCDMIIRQHTLDEAFNDALCNYVYDTHDNLTLRKGLIDTKRLTKEIVQEIVAEGELYVMSNDPISYGYSGNAPEIDNRYDYEDEIKEAVYKVIVADQRDYIASNGKKGYDYLTYGDFDTVVDNVTSCVLFDSRVCEGDTYRDQFGAYLQVGTYLKNDDKAQECLNGNMAVLCDAIDNRKSDENAFDILVKGAVYCDAAIRSEYVIASSAVCDAVMRVEAEMGISLDDATPDEKKAAFEKTYIRKEADNPYEGEYDAMIADLQAEGFFDILEEPKSYDAEPEY